MIAFEPHNKNGKLIKLYFDTKAEAMIKLNVSRPTIDKICRAGDTIYKYAPNIAKVSKVSVNEVLAKLKKM
tara:strand:+ start:121 stop:333 length:213 start_codon:yes stop_codon:yes gene_type:complete